MMHKRIQTAPSSAARVALVADLESALSAVLETIEDYGRLIAQREADTEKLLGMRLQLAQNRLAHGSIIRRIAEYLRIQNPSAELAIRSLQPEHAGLLHRTSAHTQKWTLEAVENDWAAYCRETREILDCWKRRVTVEGNILRRTMEEN